MKNVRVLDCTLRDGGRIVDCAFDDREIRELSDRLGSAKIDIIEVGFLRDRRKTDYRGNSTFFTDVDQIRPFVNKEKKHLIYTAFVDYGMCDIDALKPCDGTSIDGIRLGFTKKNYDEAREDVVRWAHVIKERGYQLFVQGVNSLNYSDSELLEVVKMVNEIQPYSFGIVDTYGAMYADDVDRLYGLIDHNMRSDICINFHSHNNYQLSFALAQEVIKLGSGGNRKIIIDSTLSGMGKVAGNLNTELIIDFLVRKLHYDYDLDAVLDCIDDYIYKYSLKHRWGYSVPALMAGIYKSHPNNVIYLTEKFRLNTKDIGKLLSMIDPGTRQRYDYDNIQRIYTEYSGENIDDAAAVEKLKKEFEGKDILVLVPGSSVNTYKDKISSYIAEKRPVIVSVNYDSDYQDSWSFYGNKKRYDHGAFGKKDHRTIVTSNMETRDSTHIRVNYHSLLSREHELFDDSTIMLLNLLKKVEPRRICFAGYDGFTQKAESNFKDSTFQNERHDTKNFDRINRDIASMIEEFAEAISDKCEIIFLTPSCYQNYIDRKDIVFKNWSRS